MSSSSACATEGSNGSDIRWAYTLPALVLALPTLPFYILLPVHYSEHSSLSFAEVGVILLLARLTDLASDLLAARLCDRPLGSWGRKGWIGLGALLAAIALLALPHPPATAAGLWLGGFSVLLYSGWTLIQIPYTAWLASLGQSDTERRELAALRERCTLAGLCLSALLPALLSLAGADSGQLFTALALATLLLGLPLMVQLLRRVPEPRLLATARDWRAFYRLPWQRRLLLGWFFNGLANALPAVLFPLLVTSVLLRPETDRSLLLLLYFGFALLAVPLWQALARRRGEVQSWSLAMAAAVLVFVSVPLLPTTLMPYLVMIALTGLCLGADLFLPHSLQARLARREASEVGRFQPALHYAGASLVNKLALGVGVALAPLLIAFGGWPTDAAAPSPTAIFALLVIYAWLPCVFKVVAIALIWPLAQLEVTDE